MLVLFSLLGAVQANYFIYGAHQIPHPDKADKGGEDAYYADV